MAGTIVELLQAVLADGTERRFARLMMTDDPLVRRLRGREVEALAYALRAGQTAADEIASRYGRDPEAVAAALGVSVARGEEDAKAGHSVHLSEYCDRPPGITLHMRSLLAVREMIEANDLAPLLGLSDPVPLHLAHELYHHLEAKRLTAGTAGYRLENFRLGPLRWGTGFPSLSEIAADKFAIALARQELHPKVIHFLVIYQYNPDYAWELLAKLRDLPA